MCNSQVIKHSNLTDLVGPSVQLVENEGVPDQLFHGSLTWSQLRSGLSLHCSDCRELNNFTTQTAVDPHLALLIFLEGRSDVDFDDHRVSLGCRNAGNGRPIAEGVALALTEPVLFRRRARRGAQIRKVCVSLTPEWFETTGADYAVACKLAGLDRQHLATRHWQPSTRLLALVEQMLSPPDYNPLLQHLYLESRALEIASEAMSLASGQPAPTQRGLRPQEHQRIRRTLELLQSDTAADWSLERIAREVGVNVSTLQRQFQASQGMSLFEYQRRHKLLQAREALERQGVSVSHAAWQAGYSSAANFSTAFKRAFGLTPKQARARI